MKDRVNATIDPGNRAALLAEAARQRRSLSWVLNDVVAAWAARSTSGATAEAEQLTAAGLGHD